MRFSGFEIRELSKAWFAVSLAFAIALSSGPVSISRIFSINFTKSFVFAGLTVGIAFLGHELAHKYLAQKYGCFAEFMADNKMLLLAVICSLFGFVFAAPGAVVIHGRVTKEQFGRVSAAGIIVNLALGVVCLCLMPLIASHMLLEFLAFGASINSWLALFNLLPFMPFDGAKVLMWNKKIYFGLAAACLALTFIVQLMVF